MHHWRLGFVRFGKSCSLGSGLCSNSMAVPFGFGQSDIFVQFSSPTCYVWATFLLTFWAFSGFLSRHITKLLLLLFIDKDLKLSDCYLAETNASTKIRIKFCLRPRLSENTRLTLLHRLIGLETGSAIFVEINPVTASWSSVWFEQPDSSVRCSDSIWFPS